MQVFAGIEVFVAVVEAGSVTGAAARLQAAKSSVSETLRGLEERLGVRLLDRGARRLRPTEAGEAFYARCRRLLAEEEAARLEVQALQRAPVGTLRVAVPDGFGEAWVVPALADFLPDNPALAVELVEAAAHARLVEDSLDLAIRVMATPAAGQVVRRLGRSQAIIVASPAYLSHRGMPTTPADLAAHACVGFSPLPWRDTWVLGEESVAVRPVLLTDSSASLRAAALAGIGLVALPDWSVLDALSQGRLRQVLAELPTVPKGIYAVYPTNRLITPKVRAFVDHLARWVRARGLAA
ncbi:LysR family transcriptional regulator [Roseomonas sp. AR75]|uniref:LysR family transcriptional regulator n=1 Tax=Roseomonas sp. AR75 TaxID=2562311 RepID=UPI0014856CA2|nr:LysR family transcriptional regulator [Roseomonas sp. AR75]